MMIFEVRAKHKKQIESTTFVFCTFDFFSLTPPKTKQEATKTKTENKNKTKHSKTQKAMLNQTRSGAFRAFVRMEALRSC